MLFASIWELKASILLIGWPQTGRLMMIAPFFRHSHDIPTTFPSCQGNARHLASLLIGTISPRHPPHQTSESNMMTEVPKADIEFVTKQNPGLTLTSWKSTSTDILKYGYINITSLVAVPSYSQDFNSLLSQFTSKASAVQRRTRAVCKCPKGLHAKKQNLEPKWQQFSVAISTSGDWLIWLIHQSTSEHQLQWSRVYLPISVIQHGKIGINKTMTWYSIHGTSAQKFKKKSKPRCFLCANTIWLWLIVRHGKIHPCY